MSGGVEWAAPVQVSPPSLRVCKGLLGARGCDVGGRVPLQASLPPWLGFQSE